MMLKKAFFFCFILFFLCFDLTAEPYVLFLRDNLQLAKKGDYIVTSQGKNYSLLHIYGRTNRALTIEEISVPAGKIPKQNFSWPSWVEKGACGNTSHVVYTIDLVSGQMFNFYSYKKGNWYEMSPKDAFLPTLLNLRFNFVPPEERRRVGVSLRSGAKDRRPYWEPQMVVNGYTVEGVRFDVWRATWPKDGSDISGKGIEVYLPEPGYGYPAYFPYWLQISGLVGSAKVRIVDSGTGLNSFLSLPYLPK